MKYAHSRRIRQKQYKRRHVKPRRTLGRVNPGIRMKNDNMVYMKQLHRGPRSNYQLYGRHGNPSGLIFKNSPTGYNLRGSQGKSYSKSKKTKFARNSFKSEL